jgi:hypothetical protein
MPQYTPPLRDMQFVLHELLRSRADQLKLHAAPCRDRCRHPQRRAREGGKFAAEVVAPLNISGDGEGCRLDKATHEVTAPKGFKEAYAAVRRRAAGRH